LTVVLALIVVVYLAAAELVKPFAINGSASARPPAVGGHLSPLRKAAA
jgi:hypothetical protein